MAWSRLREQDPVTLNRLKKRLLTSSPARSGHRICPVETGIRDLGTAVAVYLTLAAGLNMALVVLGLCLCFSVGLHKVTGQVREPGQEAM